MNKEAEEKKKVYVLSPYDSRCSEDRAWQELPPFLYFEKKYISKGW